MKLPHLMGPLALLTLFLSSCAVPFPRIPLGGGPPQQPPITYPQGPQYPQPGPQYPQPGPQYPQPGPQQPTIPVVNVPSQPQPAPVNASASFVSLSPSLVSASGNTIRGSERAFPPPAVNGMVKAPYPNRTAYRDIEVQFDPPQVFANSAVTWSFQAFGGSLRGSLPAGIPTFSTPPGASQPFNRLDSRGRTTVRVSLPGKGLNRGRVTVASSNNPRINNVIELSVPAVIVIDPGHGGNTNLAGSSFNNSRTPSGTLEKTLTLDYGKELAQAVTKIFEGRGIPSRVALTRDRDINVSGRNRAELARDLGADAFVTIHFNGFDGTKRGTLEVQRTTAEGNLNFSEDTTLANRCVQAAVRAFKVFDSAANVRNPVPYATSVSSDPYQGNTSSDHPVRHAYIELDFIDNPAVDQLMTGSQRHQVRATVAAAMAQAIFDDIAAHRG